jgi:predicted N-formylglutamate amidohydrolase
MDLTPDLTRPCDSAALLTRYSRLVCDPNRAVAEPRNKRAVDHPELEPRGGNAFKQVAE